MVQRVSEEYKEEKEKFPDDHQIRKEMFEFHPRPFIDYSEIEGEMPDQSREVISIGPSSRAYKVLMDQQNPTEFHEGLRNFVATYPREGYKLVTNYFKPNPYDGLYFIERYGVQLARIRILKQGKKFDVTINLALTPANEYSIGVVDYRSFLLDFSKFILHFFKWLEDFWDVPPPQSILFEATARQEAGFFSPIKGPSKAEIVGNNTGTQSKTTENVITNRGKSEPMVANNPDRQNNTDVLLVTVTEVETDAVISVYKERTGIKPTFFYGQHNAYFDLGEIGGAQVRLVQSSGMGSGGEIGSQTTVTDAISDLSPSDIIMVGIAFGIDPVKTEIGKILISEYLQDYNLQKVGTDASGQPIITPRRAKVTASGRMISRFRIGARFWKEGESTEFGLILSGDKLINNIDYRQTLETLFPGTIGGEMEGAGLYAAAAHHKKDWIVVKAVCDYADGNKDTDKETRQTVAAKNAADFTFTVLEQRGFAPIGPARPLSQNISPSILSASPSTDSSDPMEKIISVRLEGLTHHNPNDRKQDVITIGKLARNNKPRVIQVLQGLLTFGLPDVEIQAAIELAYLTNDEKAIPPLSYALYTNDPEFRNEAADALANLGAPAFLTFEEAIKPTYPIEIRRLAVTGLGKIKTQKAIKSLILALEDKQLRSAAIDLLGQIADPMTINGLIQLLGELDGIGIQAASALLKIGTIAIPELGARVEGLKTHRKTKDLIAGRTAIWVLGQMADVRSVVYLLGAINDDEHSVGEELRPAFNHIGEERFNNSKLPEFRSEKKIVFEPKIQQEVIQILVRHLNQEYKINGIDVTRGVAWSIVAALEQIQTDEAVDGLVKALENPDREMQLVVARSLGYIGNNRSVSGIKKVLLNSSDRNSDLTQALLEALNEIGSPEALEAIRIFDEQKNLIRELDEAILSQNYHSVIEIGENLQKLGRIDAKVTAHLADAYNSRGLEFFNNNIDQAIVNFGLASSLDPKLDYSYYNLGLAYQKKHDNDNAIVNFQKASDLGSDPAKKTLEKIRSVQAQKIKQDNQQRIDALLPLFERVFASENWEDTIKLGQEILSLENENKNVREKTAESYRRRGLIRQDAVAVSEAFEDFTTAIELFPQDGKAFYNRGLLFKSLGDKTRYCEDMRKAADFGIIASLSEIRNCL